MFMLPILGPFLLRKGIKGAMSAGIQVVVLLLIAAAVWFLVISPIRNHFKHITDLETANEQLKVKVTKAEGQRDVAIQLNRDNERTRVVAQDIRANSQRIAGEERAAASARAATYKEIGNAIRNTPTPPAQPGRTGVAPVVTNTLDSLWSH